MVALFAIVVRLGQHVLNMFLGSVLNSHCLLKESKWKRRAEADKVTNIIREFPNRGPLLPIPTCNGQEGSFGSCSCSVQGIEY